MKAEYLILLGKRVMPLVKRSQYEVHNFDRVGNLEYLKGEAKRLYAKRVIDEATKEQLRDNREQEWEVFSIHSDGTFTLRSDMGYEQAFVKRNDFRLLKSATT